LQQSQVSVPQSQAAIPQSSQAQANQTAAGPPGQQKQPQPGQPQTLSQQAAQQQAAQQQQQQHQQHQQQPSQQQRAMAHAQLQARNLAMMRQEQNRADKGRYILNFINFADKLASFRTDQKPNDMNYWKQFIEQHFIEGGTMRIALFDQKEQRTKQFEVVTSLLPRYFWTQFDANVEQIQIILEGTQETPIGADYHHILAERARMFYWFNDGSQVRYDSI
jgi:hypothetical protein